MKKISVIILNYFKAQRVLENINFLKNQKWDFELEIILVDNSCNKNEEEILKSCEFKDVKIIINKENTWYTKWNNIWAKSATWDFILILNPDILIKDKNVILELFNQLKNNSKIWIIWPKQINDNWEIPIIIRKFPKLFAQISRRTFLKNLPIIKWIVKKDECRDLDWNSTQSVDWIQSSCFMLSKNLWDKIWGFDENYRIFLADPEICFQSWRLWKKVVYFPEVSVFADWKRASWWWIIKFFQSWVLRQHFLDSIKYFFKHIFSWNPREEYFIKENKKLNLTF
jgi:N-acetylglucosaminyl-diphospho-decaprenol L-rhamnosyltransferase